MKPWQIKYIYIIIVLFGMNSSNLNAQRDTLIYIGDPMCSWCYGFAPEMDKILEAFPDTPFEIIMGGLRPDGSETMMELKDFLYTHWQEVHKVSGQDFNYGILSKTSVMYNTEPACRAVFVMGMLEPEKKYAYFKAVQKGFYVDNHLPHDEELYGEIATHFDIDYENFMKLYRQPRTKEAVYKEFEKAERYGATGFPTVIAKINGKHFLVTQGYQKADRLIALLKARGLQ